MVSTTKGNIVEEEAAAAVVEVAEETGSFSTEDYDDDEEEAYVGAVAQDAEAVADMEEADDIAAADGPTTAMSWTEYVVAYKWLSESEINFILSWPRKPFESMDLHKDMICTRFLCNLPSWGDYKLSIFICVSLSILLAARSMTQ
jgi:hypothetical protein